MPLGLPVTPLMKSLSDPPLTDRFTPVALVPGVEPVRALKLVCAVLKVTLPPSAGPESMPLSASTPTSISAPTSRVMPEAVDAGPSHACAAAGLRRAGQTDLALARADIPALGKPAGDEN